MQAEARARWQIRLVRAVFRDNHGRDDMLSVRERSMDLLDRTEADMDRHADWHGQVLIELEAVRSEVRGDFPSTADVEPG